MYGKNKEKPKKFHLQYNYKSDLNEKHEEIPIGRKLYVRLFECVGVQTEKNH